jgi:hypothetical protein
LTARFSKGGRDDGVVFTYSSRANDRDDLRAAIDGDRVRVVTHAGVRGVGRGDDDIAK